MYGLVRSRDFVCILLCLYLYIFYFVNLDCFSKNKNV